MCFKPSVRHGSIGLRVPQRAARKREISARDDGPERALKTQLIDYRDLTVRTNPREMALIREEAEAVAIERVSGP